ncbi:MAG: SDR family oxidoreductase, partial [Candidatus Humimicrobiaceae bacterium]
LARIINQYVNFSKTFYGLVHQFFNIPAFCNITNEAMGFVCDVTKSGDVKELMNQTVKSFGKIDVLVNNAGKNPAREFTAENMTEEEWEEYFAINVKGTWLVSKYAIPEMRKAGGGSIIMISSISAHIGQRGTGCYNSTKAAQEGLVKSMALDFAKDNIRVNAVCPGWVLTDRTKDVRMKMMDEIIDMHPIGRIGQPEDIGWPCVYLASDESTWVTGASFAIDGGYRAQ